MGKAAGSSLGDLPFLGCFRNSPRSPSEASFTPAREQAQPDSLTLWARAKSEVCDLLQNC